MPVSIRSCYKMKWGFIIYIYVSNMIYFKHIWLNFKMIFMCVYFVCVCGRLWTCHNAELVLTGQLPRVSYCLLLSRSQGLNSGHQSLFPWIFKKWFYSAPSIIDLLTDWLSLLSKCSLCESRHFVHVPHSCCSRQGGGGEEHGHLRPK